MSVYEQVVLRAILQTEIEQLELFWSYVILIRLMLPWPFCVYENQCQMYLYDCDSSPELSNYHRSVLQFPSIRD